MENNLQHIAVGCCVVVFYAASAFGQNYDTCAHLKLWENQNPQPGDIQIAKEQYDTLRLFIEKCAASDSESWYAFSHISSAVQLMSEDTTRYDIYRNWLISVLYLNTTQPYYF